MLDKHLMQARVLTYPEQKSTWDLPEQSSYETVNAVQGLTHWCSGCLYGLAELVKANAEILTIHRCTSAHISNTFKHDSAHRVALFCAPWFVHTHITSHAHLMVYTCKGNQAADAKHRNPDA